MSLNLETFIQNLINWGVADILLPFILVFTLVFATLEKTGILGTKGDSKTKNFNAIVAFVMGLAVVAARGTQYDIVAIINAAIPNVALIVVVLVMFLLVYAILGGDFDLDNHGKALKHIFVAGAFIAVITIFLIASGTNVGGIFNYLDSDVFTFLGIIGIFGGVIWLIMH